MDEFRSCHHAYTLRIAQHIRLCFVHLYQRLNTVLCSRNGREDMRPIPADEVHASHSFSAFSATAEVGVVLTTHKEICDYYVGLRRRKCSSWKKSFCSEFQH